MTRTLERALRVLVQLDVALTIVAVVAATVGADPQVVGYWTTLGALAMAMVIAGVLMVLLVLALRPRGHA